MKTQLFLTSNAAVRPGSQDQHFAQIPKSVILDMVQLVKRGAMTTELQLVLSLSAKVTRVDT